jgi:hypothetical protein
MKKVTPMPEWMARQLALVDKKVRGWSEGKQEWAGVDIMKEIKMEEIIEQVDNKEKLVIETDFTVEGTKVFLGKEPIELLQNLTFIANAESDCITLYLKKCQRSNTLGDFPEEQDDVVFSIEDLKKFLA